ncbi:interleukin 1 receptor associated kinase 4 tube [Andrena cerasifolii]|uniref:interleukin 1 receptor associated kinase 4 tube n=1 Tax=Andrena cerasifolii TaxID=2819439 RepID=UPI0040384851
MSQSTVCLDTELRKLRPAELYMLGQILNISDSWKKLMAIVPKDRCPDLPKFNAEHFSMIEQAAQQQRRSAAEIFLAEWGTMGKHRPTLRTLLNLLVKAELFRAADYVAGDILKEELPKRPKCGPAAPVDISDEVIRQLLEENMEDISFKESLIFGLPSESNDNQATSPTERGIRSSLERNMQSTKLVSVQEGGERYLGNVQNVNIQWKRVEATNAVVSDLMKFSSERSVEECRTQGNPRGARIPSSIGNQLRACAFGKHEMSSKELPTVLHEFGQTAEQRKQEVPSDYLPVFFHDSVVESSNASIKTPTSDSLNISNLNINQSEMTSFELPLCVAELNGKSATDQNNIVITRIEENVMQNALCSQELPITVAEYNK